MRTHVGTWFAGALVVLAAGCGGGGETKTVTVPAETPAADTGGEATATATPAADGTATPGPAGDAPGIAEIPGSLEGERVTFVLTELRRSGPTVILNARLQHAAPGASDSLQVASTFDDGVAQKLDTDADEQPDVFDGVALVDPEGRKKYLVARDETGRCVCTNNLNSTFVAPDAPVELTATLTAPPETVTQVDLLVPRFKTLRAVPISE